MYKNLGLKEGMFVQLTGMEVKNENDIFVVANNYNIEGKYAICKNEFTLRKVKLNGELANAKYGIVFLSDREMKKNPNIQIKVVTDLKKAKKEVNEYIKNRESGEVVTTFKVSENQELRHLCIIRFKEGLRFGTFGEKYISKDSLFLVKVRENKTIYIEELGKKGQTIYNNRMFGCTMSLTNKIAEVSEVVEKVETLKGDIEKITNIKVEEVKNEIIEVFEESQQEVKEVIEKSIEATEQPTQQEENTNNNINVTVSFNQEKQGIELRFSEKPSQEILSQLSLNKFRYSKFQKMWYCKDSEEKREFLKSIEFLSSQENNNSSESNESIQIEISEAKEFSYPEIDINDIENYTISAELSKRENDGHWVFRTKERNHQEEIQSYLKQCNNSVMEVIENTENQQIIYYAKKWLQSYKKRYYKNYVSRLSNQANNPSIWTTGRGGRDSYKYNKQLSRYDKLMKECCELQDEFNSKIGTIKNKIHNEKRTEQKKQLEELKKDIDVKSIKFKRSKLDNINGIKLDYTCTAYEYNNNYILSNYWGKFRIYNAQGKEIGKSNSLEDAKITLLALINNSVNV